MPTPASTRYALAGILLLAAGLRLPLLDRVPPPLNQDEGSRGYDAWCLWELGTDRYGQSWPLFLKSFGPGDYTAALSTYLIVPFVAVLGPTPTAMRLPSAILGVATVWGMWLLVRAVRTHSIDDAGAPAIESSAGLPARDQPEEAHAGDTRLAALAALMLAICPWHITLTRTAHESALVPFFLVFGLLGMARAGLPPFGQFLSHGNVRRSAAWAVFGGWMLAWCAWVYPASRMVVPILLAALVLTNLRAWRRALGRNRRSVVLAFAGAMLLLSFPLWLTLLSAPERLAARAREIVLFHAPFPAGEIVRRFGANYLTEFDPRVLGWRMDDIAGASTGGYGRLLVVQVPLALIGLVCLLRRCRHCGPSRLVLALLLLAPLPAAICWDWNPHPMRPLPASVAWAIACAVGTVWLVDRLARSLRSARAAAVVVALCLGANLAWFGWAYGIRYAGDAGVADSFQENLAVAFDYVGRQGRDFDFVWVSDIPNQPYIYALLYAPIPPREFVGGLPFVTVAWRNRFEHCVRTGRFLFCPEFDPRVPWKVHAMREFVRQIPADAQARGVVIDVPGHGPPGRVIHVIPRRNGQPGLELRDVRAGAVREWHVERIGE